jgi:hypothetical protein
MQISLDVFTQHHYPPHDSPLAQPSGPEGGVMDLDPVFRTRLTWHSLPGVVPLGDICNRTGQWRSRLLKKGAVDRASQALVNRERA